MEEILKIKKHQWSINIFSLIEEEGISMSRRRRSTRVTYCVCGR